jgi:hypothetical protein
MPYLGEIPPQAIGSGQVRGGPIQVQTVPTPILLLVFSRDGILELHF